MKFHKDQVRQNKKKQENSIDNAENEAEGISISPPAFSPKINVVQGKNIQKEEKEEKPSLDQEYEFDNDTPNANGLPGQLKQNLESMSGFDLSDVSIHKNSSKPAQLQAEAFAQGSEIHLAPGKERHLPHEAWHVVQQKQGRVQPTENIGGKAINDEFRLEHEADQMGDRALKGSFTMQMKTTDAATSGQGPIQMWNPFKKAREKKQQKAALKALNAPNNLTTDLDNEHFIGGADQASEVWKAKAERNIGTSNTNKGFVKKRVKQDDWSNDTTANLGFKENDRKFNDTTGRLALAEDPNLLARQVVSSRLDKKLGFNVLADEIFSKDKDGNDVGLSAMADGDQVMKKDPANEHGIQIEEYRHFDIRNNPNMMKGLTDLQLMDALTGQLDRHSGNMFIDRATGKVTGIDNDMAFGVRDASGKENANLSTPNSLPGQFTGTGTDGGEFTFNQKFVDRSSAQKIIAMSEKEFIKTLSKQKGDAEELDPTAIQLAVVRFRAIKKRMQDMIDNNDPGLIDNWTPEVFDQMNKTEKVKGKNYKGDEVYEDKHTNYVSRYMHKYALAGSEDAKGRQRQGKDPNAPVWQSGQSGDKDKAGFKLGANRKKKLVAPNYPAPKPPQSKAPDYPAPAIPLESQLLPHKLLGPSPETKMLGSLKNHPLLEKEYGSSEASPVKDEEWDE